MNLLLNFVDKNKIMPNSNNNETTVTLTYFLTFFHLIRPHKIQYNSKRGQNIKTKFLLP